MAQSRMALTALSVALTLTALSSYPATVTAITPRAECSKIESVDSLKLSGFQGRWYEVALTARLFFDTSVDAKCSFLDFTPKFAAKKGSPTVLDVTRYANESLQYYPYAKPADKKVDIFTSFNSELLSACRANDDLSLLVDSVYENAANFSEASAFNNDNIYAWWDLASIAREAGLLTQADIRKASVKARAKTIVALAAKIKATYATNIARLSKQNLPSGLLKNVTSRMQKLTSAAEKLAENGGLASYVEPVKPKFRAGKEWKGSAVQGVSHKGRFTVTIPSLDKYLKYFNIIDVEGNSTKYTSALVYACNPEANGYLRHDAIILSRERTPSKNDIKRWLNDYDVALLNYLGHPTGCDTTFVPGYQDKGGDCKVNGKQLV